MESGEKDVASNAPCARAKRRVVPGVIYLSSIPMLMNAKRMKELFSEYGEVGRVYLRRDARHLANGRKLSKYTEGWLEFKDKSIAKRVALSFNNTLFGGKKRSKAYDCIWNMKYLHRFKWHHLTDQLNYEQVKHRQRMRIEIAQAKREARFFTEQVEKGRALRRLEKEVLEKEGKWERYERQIKQRLRNIVAPSGDRSELLRQIFQ